jgi:hypothetical protein
LDLSIEQKREYARRLAGIANKFNIRLQACCNALLVCEEIDKAHCIDMNRLASLWGIPLEGPEPYTPTRKGCGCTRSLDIGAYDTCLSGCLYCYANAVKEVSSLKFRV